MAEFQEVCKQWRRLCQSQEKEYQKCADCPAGDYQMCNLVISNIDDLDFQRTEEAVMSWAAEHPEPVYPTWLEYLMNAFPDCGKAYMGGNDLLWKWMWETPIPADKAEKLGLKPKEGA